VPITFGPNDADVRRLVDRARLLSPADARAILTARMACVTASTTGDGERTAQRQAVRVARRSRRFDAYLAARRAAADAFRTARRGEVGPWLGVAGAVANAAGAVALGDLLDTGDYEALYRPWRTGVAGAQLVAVGPGIERPAFGAAPSRRRRPELIGSRG